MRGWPGSATITRRSRSVKNCANIGWRDCRAASPTSCASSSKIRRAYRAKRSPEATGLKKSTRNRYIQHLQAQELVVASGDMILPAPELIE